MNTITDLTARAVSFITTIQTVLLNGAISNEREKEKLSILTIAPEEFSETMKRFIFTNKSDETADYKNLKKDSFGARAIELVWTSKETPDVALATRYTLSIAQALVEWIQNNERMQASTITRYHTKYLNSEEASEPSANHYGTYPTPFIWREVIRKILYEYPEERVNLALVLQYLPVRIVLALDGGKFDPRRQRVLQMWNVSTEFIDNLLNAEEVKYLKEFKSLQEETKLDATTLLLDDKTLFSCLYNKEVPYSFETIFKAELEEIRENRYWREREEYITNLEESITLKGRDESEIKDLFQKANDMNLYALAFSGGGIRSATFNLGILQGLAKYNLIGKFDYLSTVSGGGYIGSWLATWIKRDQSFVKVTNRLCPDKSPEPLGEELRPIRWLRMFSNYFAPDASIMSADAWTIGVTWLRNTLLNQVMIFLLLIGLLFTGNLLYQFWTYDIKSTINYSTVTVSVWSAVLLLPVSLLAGLGMHAYHSEGLPWAGIKREGTKKVSMLIWIIAVLAAYLLSAWMSSQWKINAAINASTLGKLEALWPAAAVVFASLILVAYLGKYYKCIVEFTPDWQPGWALLNANFFLIITALIAAAAGLFCLVAMWSILENIATSTNSYVAENKDKLQFILGVPMALEVFSLAVVTRMAFLGKYFPDERREWWGRMGGYVHRISFLWICISTSALLGGHLVSNIFKNWWTGLPAAGGWIAVVWSAVKAAFSAKTTGKDDVKSSSSSYLNIISLVGPYIFILGLLVFLPGLIAPISSKVDAVINAIGKYYRIPHFMDTPEFKIFLVIFLAGLILLILSWRIGVNEFSMHHFYRNRLVRAYLAASRRSTNRQITSNPFTGFDMLDDEKLHTLRCEYGYHGPYPILNTALNASEVVDLDRQDRKAESFIFSPLYCGFDFSMIKASADVKAKSYDYAYRETKQYAYRDGGPTIGTAMAISGAAVNPNQGYHSSAATAFLLTVFNLQMGWWIGNPRKSTWKRSDPRLGLSQIIFNLIGKTNTKNNYVALSDGGHFDNMGLYEMIRRRCSYIVVCDAEQDDDFTCEGFANAIRRCRIDFGAEIEIDISHIVNRSDENYSTSHYAIGDIKYPDIESVSGKLLYIKSSIIGDEPVDVYEYSKKNKTFPQQSTADQFFNEEQFESYRKLGLHIIQKMLNDTQDSEIRSFFQLTTSASADN